MNQFSRCLNLGACGCADLAKVTVAVDVLFLVAVLQLVVFNVKPECLHDTGTCLCVHTQETGQTRVQFVLWRLGTNTNQSKERWLNTHAGHPADGSGHRARGGTW